MVREKAAASSTSKAPRGTNATTRNTKAKNTNANDDVRRETPLQAILFADSFTETFRPISLSMPKVLLPLANVPMIEYSLEFLVSSGVQEVVVFCTHHAEKIEEFIKTQSQVAKRIYVHCISSPTCVTAGDALREIDRQQLIQSNPFILMSGDVVANVNLSAIIKEHQARKKKDPSCMMTSVFKEIQPNFSTNIRPLTDELIVGINTATSQILLYEDDPRKKSTRLATIFLDEHAQIALRSDLMDCYIDVCSPEVLLKFAEDFDYQDLRRDFFHNEVQNYELGKKFFVKIVTDEFAARVMDPRTYSGITRAILQRWVFPIVPDANYLGVEGTNYSYHRGMIYKDENVTLSRTFTVGRESILGAGSSFGDHSTVTKSAVGRNCSIGKNVVIEGSFLWSNVVVEDGVTIKNAILCDNVVVKKGATISEGCILSLGVVIGEGFHLKPFSKVTTSQVTEKDDGFSSEEEDEDEETDNKNAEATSTTTADEQVGWKEHEVGVGGVGRLWTLDEDDIEVDSDESDDDDDEQADEHNAVTRTELRRLEKLKTLLIGANDVVAKQTQKWDEWETLSSSDEEDEDGDDLAELGLQDQEVPFHQIIRDMVISGDNAGHGIDDLFLEIKSFKFAQNRSFADVLGAILPGLLALVPTQDQTNVAILTHVRTKFQKWTSVVQRCLVEPADQVAVINALEKFCLIEENRPLWSPLFRFLLQTVYDLEWVGEDVILEWHVTRIDVAATEETLANTKEVQEFIDWLEEEEEDSEEDEEDEEDSDESD